MIFHFSLLRFFRKKKSKDGKPSISPEQIESPPRNTRHEEIPDDIAYRVKTNNTNNTQRPHSMAPGDFQKHHKDNKFIKPDQMQKELVQAKIEEMKRIKSGERKKRKSDNEINRVGRNPSPNKDEFGFKSGYNTWNVHDASNMREKSKQFFMSEKTQSTSAPSSSNHSNHHQKQQSDSARSSTRSSSLQRQSSLPPRTKKESVDIQRVLPRAPSGPMYKSPEQKPRSLSKNSDTQIHHVRSTSSPSSRTSTPHKEGGGLPVKQRNSATPLSFVAANRLKRPEETEIRYSSISDITRSGGSVKISHKAEI